MSIHLNTHGLDIEIELSLNPSSNLNIPYEDWITCYIKLIVPGFTGSFPIELEQADFNRFLRELRQMDRSIGKSMQAILTGAEQDFLLEIKSDRFGHVFGKYKFIHRWKISETKLSGSFEMDQSYIQLLMREIQNSLMQLEGK
jgi:hypothetical protein